MLFSCKKRAYWEAKVVAAFSNSTERWQILNRLMCEDVESQIFDSATADAFSKFFQTRWNLCDLLQKMLPLRVSLLALSLAALIHFSP